MSRDPRRKMLGGAKDSLGSYLKESSGPPPPFILENILFDKQLKFVKDPHSFKVAVCSRRAGKTVACAADLIHTAITNPETVGLYVTLSRNNAKKIIWREIQKLNRDYGLKGVEDQTELSMTFPNRSIIYASGAKDSSEIEKFRGLALRKAYIDECQSFRPYIQELIDDVISPALMDYAGDLCLIGTPGPIPAGFFYDCAEKSNSSWTKHSWTYFDNPFIVQKAKKSHQDLLQRELTRRGVTIQDPSIQREWFGKWVLDSDSLLLKYNPDLNHYTSLPEYTPKDKWNYLLGIDLGFVDADALAILAWNEKSPDTYLVEEIVIPKQGITELVGQIQYLQKRYDIAKMVIDEGGLGKKIAEEMRRRHHLPVQAADKARKMENITFLNDALRTGKFKAKAESRFAQDSMLVEIDRAKSTPDKLKVSDKYHSDIIDAVLYAFKESPAYAYQPPEVKLTPGSAEWAKQHQEDMFAAAVDHFEQLQESQKRLNGDYE